MKPKRYLFGLPLFPVATIRYGAPVFAGLTILISGIGAGNATAAIYGGSSSNSPSAPQPGTAPVGGTAPDASATVRANALEALARTQQAVGAAAALQAAARAAATANNAGPNPNNPSQNLPDVPNGLVTGGLQIAPGATTGSNLWQGAELPTEAIANGLSTVTVRQTAQQALLTWQTFNVGKNTTLKFDQSNTGAAASQSIAFNKVVDPTANPTQILGQIQAQGQVYIINPNGIIFGGASKVDVGALTASSLPINDNLVARGLLNNPTQEFLFNGLGHTGKLGDVTVNAGARLTTPVSADGNGGRIALVGANVTNNGTLTSPNGQVILAAGLQVGIAAHASTDPSLRGLDIYVGAVTDPASALSPYAGTATNNGIIDIPRASTLLTGKAVNQNGIISSTTSVALNGRIDLSANYDAVANPAFNASNPSSGNPFLYRSTGSVSLGSNSVTSILPQWESTETTVGTELALRSRIEIQGKTIHFDEGSLIYAPNAIANINAGVWNFIPSITLPSSTFITSSGQVYLDQNSSINLSGTVDASASASQNLLTLELRGSELAPAPLQREGELRGNTITVDLSRTGVYEGRFWVGTPLADLTGYVGLVQRNVSQLTTTGGTLSISAGSSIVARETSNIDVSGGWTNFSGAKIATTRLATADGRIIDIADATPDLVYSGVKENSVTILYKGWGIAETFGVALSPTAGSYKAAYMQGADGGTLNLKAPAQVLDGKLTGHTVAGAHQLVNSSGTSSLPKAASLNIAFQSQRLVQTSALEYYPTPPDIILGEEANQVPAADFAIDANGDPAPLANDRLETVHLSATKLTGNGFGNVSISNPEGSILVSENTSLDLGGGVSLSLTSSDINIQGDIRSAGGSLSFNVLNISPYLDKLGIINGDRVELPLTPGLGIFTLGENASLSTAGTVTGLNPSTAVFKNGGSISIRAHSADLEAGSVIDVSDGFTQTAAARGKFGNAGSISIRTGQDITQNSVLGGYLNLGSTLLGYTGTGGTAGSLTLQAQTIQVGGTAPSGGNVFHLDPSFFNQGGFGTFTLAGLSASGSNPALLVAEGTTVQPIVKTREAVFGDPGSNTFSVQTVEEVEGIRPAAKINLTAPGVVALSGGGISSRGDLVIGEGAVVKTDAGGSITTTGHTVTILGSLIAPGGTITIGGGNSTNTIFGVDIQPLITTYIGSNAHISAAGTTVLLPDAYGRRVGQVYSGGNITVTGNIAAADGAVLDVSGTSGILDLDPLTNPIVPLPRTGAIGNLSTTTSYNLPVIPTKVDTNGGNITVRGGQILSSDATLLGNAGGSTALGGTLNVSSGRFYQTGVVPPVSATNLTVTQDGTLVPSSIPDSAAAIGSTLENGGRFTVSSFTGSGFDSLSLGGVVAFSGNVDIHARGELRVASNGFVSANSTVNLNAAYIAIGRDLAAPVLPEENVSPFSGTNVLPTHGTGTLSINADLIDLGTLSAQNIGTLNLTADNGEIRGSGTVHVAGDLNLRAGQIYPTTASTLSLIAYDYLEGSTNTSGKVSITASGTKALPYSAGGTLNIYASVIDQRGTLRAPFGTINLGWDGTGTAPKDLLAGTATSTFPITRSLTLGAGSITSVSAVDPVTGKALVLPYGVSTNGENWIDPRGVDITTAGPPAKTIALSSGNLVTEQGSTIDLRGGGDLYAYRFVSGLGGPSDILASLNSFAVIPGYEGPAPVAPYNQSTSDNNLIDSSGPGYVNSGLKVGDKIYLSGSSNLPAGYYTLLPARYALMPGAVLVTPKSDSGIETVTLPDKSSIVSGFRYNSLNDERQLPTLTTRFEVASASVFRQRAFYEDYLANTFFPNRAAALNNTVPPLPKDSGYLLFQATQSLDLHGSVRSSSVSGGLGANIDISTQLATYISDGLGAPAGSISLDASVLSSFGAESLLIGGKRLRTASGTNVVTTAQSVTVNNPGTPLSAKDLILVAKDGITISPNSVLSSTGASTAPAETLMLSGNGALVRVAAATSAPVIRTGVTSATAPLLTISSGSTISGGSITLDSSSTLSLASDAELNASAYSLSSGKISLLLDNPGSLSANPGLVLTNSTLQDLAGASAISLVSYSSIDLYGTGTFGGPSLTDLTLSSGEIHGINQGPGSTKITAGKLTLANIGNVNNGSPAATSGSLAFEARTITLGANHIAANGYEAVTLRATDGITGDGQGTFSAQKDLTILAPRVTGTPGAIRNITAGGTLALSSPGTTSSPIAAGLGSSLTLTAASISANTEIFLPSGILELHATSGNVEVGGLLDVSGTAKRFNDTTKYTDAGEIRLNADSGNVVINTSGVLNLSAPAGGGDAGTLAVSNPTGTFTASGTLLASSGSNGSGAIFKLDTSALPSLGLLAESLTNSGFTGGQQFRVRTGDVLIDLVPDSEDSITSSDFRVSADQGSITVRRTIDASGRTGGNIVLSANKNLILEDGAILDASGEIFNTAGKGGQITLEAGSQRNGIAGTGTLDIRTGSAIDLSVASKVEGSVDTPGSSAYLGQLSGKLHLRAPQNANGTDFSVAAINGSIIGASSIIAEGYRIYDLTSSGGDISESVRNQIHNDGVHYLGAAGSPTTAHDTILGRLLSNNAGLDSVLVLASGAEIINRNGNLTLGDSSSTTTSDWDLSGFRYGAKGAAGVLTLRASGNIVFNNALSDGFTPTLQNSNTSWLWLAPLSARNSNLPVNAQSWSYRISAGADLAAADFSQTLATSALAANAGNLQLGKFATNTSTTTGNNATTASAIANRFQVIRTGSGDISINTARDVELLNQFATIYTAGTAVSDPTMGGTFDIPALNLNNMPTVLGVAQQLYLAQYSMAGGNVDIRAGGNIEHLTRLTNGTIVADSQFQMPTNWLYRRGYVDPTTGTFGSNRWGESASTTWWVDFSNFFQGVGALGGGNVNLTAGSNISNIDAVIPTNARMTGYDTSGGVASPDASKLVELGGGNLTIRAGGNLDAGVYYVERGLGEISADGSIITNATRSVLTQSNINAGLSSSYTQLPTTLFLGKGGFDIDARGDILLGPVANPFLLPGGLLNSFWHKTYFSTYSSEAFVDVSSLGGDVTLRNSATLPSQSRSDATSLLRSWYTNKLLLSSLSASWNKPWLRLNETNVTSFATAFSLEQSSLYATSFSGDINLVGNLTLSPSPTGTLELIASGSVNALRPNGVVTLNSVPTTTWGNARINVSDADPNSIPGITSPNAYQIYAGTSPGTAGVTNNAFNFLESFNVLFRESGATVGVVLGTKQALHGAGPLHKDDEEPLRIYAQEGDISGLGLFSPKASRILAGRDISDIAFYLQNLAQDDVSIVASGRDLLAYTSSSALRVSANLSGNATNIDSSPLAGDIQISGPGTLQVLAGGNLDLGIGGNNADGTGSGITSIGNTRNPYLPFSGAHLVVGAGIKDASTLATSGLHIDAFIQEFVETPEGAEYLEEIAPGVVFANQSSEEKARLAIEVFYLILRDAGRNYSENGNYDTADTAIATLFGEDYKPTGNILTRARDIRTGNGGNIDILTPGGGISLADSTFGNTLSPPGIITASGGNISVFANDDISIGIGRIFTLRGGNEILWSSEGNIAAGSSSKTVLSAPPTRVIIDPQSAAVQTDLAGLATGGGIGVLATVAGIEPGNVDLIAPNGFVDAGDAGIRSAGNLNISANQVLNAGNISTGGVSTGTPISVSASINVGSLTTASNTTAANNAATQNANPQPVATEEIKPEEALSVFTVEVLGYGGSDEEDEEKKRQRQQLEEQQEQQ